MSVKRIKVDGTDFGSNFLEHFDRDEIQRISKDVSDEGKPLQVMLDIETLGKPQDGLTPIVSISLIPFNETAMFKELGFHIRIDMRDYDVMKFQGTNISVNMETVMWWMNQSEEARKEFQGGDTTLKDALNFVKKYIEHLDMWSDTRGTMVWAKSPDFDVTLCNQWMCELNQEYTRITPYNTARCVRTTLDDAKYVYKVGDIPSFKEEITEHNPSDDCIKQIKQLWFCWGSVSAMIP